MTVLLPVLRAAGPGALGDFVGALFNEVPEAWPTAYRKFPGSVTGGDAQRVRA